MRGVLRVTRKRQRRGGAALGAAVWLEAQPVRSASLLLLVLSLGCDTTGLVASIDPMASHDGGALDAGPAPIDAGVAVVAVVDAGTPLKGPPYPIVLAHGFFGFDRFAGARFLTYFYEVKEDLEAHGELLVFTPTVDPFNDSTTRSARLLEQLEAIRAQTGSAKVNLVAHSQGGLDARIIAHQRPDLVASVFTVSTPHRGTPVSDLVGGGLQDPRARAVVDALVGLVASPLWSESTSTSSITRALGQFETKTMADFNARWDDAPGVQYFSVAGRSSLLLAERQCEVANPNRPDFVRDYDDTRDPLSSLLTTTNLVISPNVFDLAPNDGLVPVDSAKWGTFLGCVPADHLDEIGQIAGLPPGLGNDWRHKPFYVDVVKFLRARGL